MVDTKLLSNKNILLTGFMGCGKSSVARVLAKRLDRVFLDTDEIIESNEKMSIKEIFAKYGEEYFRNLEKKIANWIKDSLKNSIIATGGGFVIFNENIKELGVIFYLEASLETIKKRVDKEEMALRPLFKEMEMVEMLYKQRVPIYKKRADYCIDANKSLDEVVDEIVAIIKKL